MKFTSKEILDRISNHNSGQLTVYQFNTNTLQVSNKYREGRIAALNYIGELVFYFQQEERRIKELFREEILKQIQQNSCLQETDYKKGLYDALNDILDQYQEYTNATKEDIGKCGYIIGESD